MHTLVFGDATSEQAHQANTAGSDIIQGGLREAARRLLPLTKSNRLSSAAEMAQDANAKLDTAQ